MPAAPTFYYFLSYAREDRNRDSGDTITTFHADLVEAVRVRTNWPYERVGFLETTAIGDGAGWPSELSAGLATCRAFVPVLSPTYFDRAFCGKEWAVFAERLHAYEAMSGVNAKLIRPVQLVAPQHLGNEPAVVAPVQRTHDQYPPAYNDDGLMQLFKHHRAGAYTRFVDAFAERLIAGVEAHELPAATAVPDIHAVESAFQQPGTQLAATLPEATPSGPRFAQFFFVAARRTELVGVRQNLSFYGDEGGLDWKPYQPEEGDEVAIIAQEVAALEKLRYEAQPLDDGFLAAIEHAVERNKIIVVLVDSWTVRLPQYRALMQQLDDREFDNCVVVIPWNLQDRETSGSRELLATAVQATFVKKALRRDPRSFVDSPRSHRELKEELGRALVAARGRILERGAVLRMAESSGAFVDSSALSTPPAL